MSSIPSVLPFADRQAVLDQLQAAGGRIIRAPLEPPWSGNDYGPATDFIRRAYERGIKADLVVGLQYREGAAAARGQGTAEYVVLLSTVGRRPGRFRAVFDPSFNRL